MCFWCSVLRKVVKISFANDPQSGQRYRDAIGDFRTADAAADLVMEDRDHSYHTAQNRHDEQQHHHGLPGEPERQRAQQLDVAAPHHARGEYHREQAEDDAGEYDRSEEHTSELQSLMRISYAVFCLKKKNKIPNNMHID